MASVLAVTDHGKSKPPRGGTTTTPSTSPPVGFGILPNSTSAASMTATTATDVGPMQTPGAASALSPNAGSAAPAPLSSSTTGPAFILIAREQHDRWTQMLERAAFAADTHYQREAKRARVLMLVAVLMLVLFLSVMTNQMKYYVGDIPSTISVYCNDFDTVQGRLMNACLGMAAVMSFVSFFTLKLEPISSCCGCCCHASDGGCYGTHENSILGIASGYSVLVLLHTCLTMGLFGVGALPDHFFGSGSPINIIHASCAMMVFTFHILLEFLRLVPLARQSGLRFVAPHVAGGGSGWSPVATEDSASRHQVTGVEMQPRLPPSAAASLMPKAGAIVAAGDAVPTSAMSRIDLATPFPGWIVVLRAVRLGTAVFVAGAFLSFVICVVLDTRMQRFWSEYAVAWGNVVNLFACAFCIPEADPTSLANPIESPSSARVVESVHRGSGAAADAMTTTPQQGRPQPPLPPGGSSSGAPPRQVAERTAAYVAPPTSSSDGQSTSASMQPTAPRSAVVQATPPTATTVPPYFDAI